MLLTRPPLRLKASFQPPLDLHVLSVPPAFILSQDQTLNLIRSLLLGFELTGIFLPFPLSCFHSIKFFLLRCYTVRFSKFCTFVRSFRSRAKCLVILSHRFQFVKYFFQLFSTFFKLFSNFFDVVRLARTNDIISYSLPFVNIFFQKILTNGEGGI